MQTKSDTNGSTTGTNGRRILPPLGYPVWVRCAGYRCMAYRDRKGLWRGLAHDEELPEVLEILSDA